MAVLLCLLACLVVFKGSSLAAQVDGVGALYWYRGTGGALEAELSLPVAEGELRAHLCGGLGPKDVTDFPKGFENPEVYYKLSRVWFGWLRPSHLLGVELSDEFIGEAISSNPLPWQDEPIPSAVLALDFNGVSLQWHAGLEPSCFPCGVLKASYGGVELYALKVDGAPGGGLSAQFEGEGVKGFFSVGSSPRVTFLSFGLLFSRFAVGGALIEGESLVEVVLRLKPSKGVKLLPFMHLSSEGAPLLGAVVKFPF